MRRLVLTALLLTGTLIAAAVHAESTTPTVTAAPAATTTPELAKPPLFSPDQRTEIEGIIKEYLVKNPQAVTEALDAMQAELNAKQEAESIAAIKANREEIYTSNLPYGGNPDGDVTIVEFFDYKCGYCRSVHQVILKLLEEDKNVRIVYKEFPILGMLSMQAARYALAANAQGKYLEMHNKLMDPDTQLEADTLRTIAQEVGLDLDKVAREMANQDHLNAIRLNLELAQKIGVRGTPGFIIGDKLYPGSLTLEGFKQAIADARNAAKNQPAAPANP